MPTSPNSLTITAMRRPWSAVRIRLRSVVFPAPRNPLRMMTGAFSDLALGSTIMARVEDGRIAVPWVVSLGGAIRRRITSRPPPSTQNPGRQGPSRNAAGTRAVPASTAVPSIDDRRLHATDRLAEGVAVLLLRVAADDRIDRQPLDLPTAPRGRLVLAVQLVGVDRRFFVHVDDGDVAVRTEANCPLLRVHLPDLRRVFAGHFHVVIEGQAALVDLRQQQRNGGLHAAEPGEAVPDRGLDHLAVDVAA